MIMLMLKSMGHWYQVDLWEGVIVIPPAHRVECFKVTAPATSSITFKALTAAPKITLIKLRMLMLVLTALSSLLSLTARMCYGLSLHSLIITREGLIITLSILIDLKGS